jgi:hypothetical protein
MLANQAKFFCKPVGQSGKCQYLSQTGNEDISTTSKFEHLNKGLLTHVTQHNPPFAGFNKTAAHSTMKNWAQQTKKEATCFNTFTRSEK